jgi:hypothetical protein
VFEPKQFSSGSQIYCGWAKKWCFVYLLHLQTVGLQLSIHVANNVRRFYWGLLFWQQYCWVFKYLRLCGAGKLREKNLVLYILILYFIVLVQLVVQCTLPYEAEKDAGNKGANFFTDKRNRQPGPMWIYNTLTISALQYGGKICALH